MAVVFFLMLIAKGTAATDECKTEGFCSQYCSNLNGVYECSCEEGYQLINRTCQATGPEPVLVYVTQKEIQAIYLRTSRQFSIHSAVTKAVSVDMDLLESRVYWTEMFGKIYSCKLDGSGFLTIPIYDLKGLEDIAVDYVVGNLYFSDGNLNRILVCKMDGSICYTLHHINVTAPRAIAVDPSEGYLYWSDWGVNTSGIYRSGMDGSERITMISKDVEWPNGIAIDHASKRLYWADARRKTIEFVTLDGATRKVLQKYEDFHPYSLAVFEDNIYFSNWGSQTLESSNKFTGNRTIMIASDASNFLMGVHVYHPVLIRQGNNPCQNSSCSHMCLIAPMNNYRCVCPEGFQLDYHGRACLHCDDYTCPVSGECISWSKVCDGKQDCEDAMDEGPLCVSSCSDNNKTCAHKCQKTPQGSKCSCYKGFVLSKDESTCEDTNECNILGRCSHFCNNTKEGFKCSCAEGYVLTTNQRTCKAEGEEAYLAYLTEDAILGISIETPDYHTQVYIVKNFASVIGMVYDAAEGLFFWADREVKTINSYSIYSAEFTISFETKEEPMILRRDWMTKNFYYTTDKRSIVCCNDKGKYCTTVITNVSSSLSGFDISPDSGLLFWSLSRHHDHNSISGVIEKASMDGSFREIIASKNVFLPTAITVDPVMEMIYWCDSVLGIIESTDFNGFRRRLIVNHLQHPISMTVFEDYIFWSDRATDSLYRCDKFNCKDRETLLRESSQINFLVIVHKAAQIQGKSRCIDNNCSHICLPTRTSSVCKCDDRNLTDTKSCEEDSSSVNQACPKDYCSQNASCVVDGDQYVCKCPLHFSGETCEKNTPPRWITRNSLNEPHPLWFVCAALIFICICLFVTLAYFYQRYRKKTTQTYSAVQFVNKCSFQESCETTEDFGRQENEYQTVMLM